MRAPKTRSYALLCFFCLLTGSLMNPIVFAKLAPATFVAPVLAALMIMCLTLALVRFRFVFAIAVISMYLLCGLGAYFGYYFSVPIKYDSIVWLLEVNPNEIKSFVSLTLCIWLICAVVLAAVHIRLAAFLRALPLRPLLIRLAGCVALAMALQQLAAFVVARGMGVQDQTQLTAAREGVKTKNIAPFSIFKVFHVLAGELQLIYMLEHLPSLADMPFEAPPPEQQPVVVFVVGESARADNFGINGYPRDTTPRLAREKNLINYGVGRSFATSTRKSHLGMMTDATLAARTPRQGPVIPLYNAAGFSTATWSLQSPVVQSGIVADTLTAASQINEHLDGQDHVLLPKLAGLLDAPAPHGTFVTLVTNGSHAQYFHNYTPEFRVFTPDDYTGETMHERIEQVRNAYDNTIVKTDAFLADAMDILREHTAVLIYASDHGESLGEAGKLFHGSGDTPEHERIPFLIWYSDAYADAYPHIVAALRSRVGQAVSHDHLYHTLIGLGGLRSAGVDPELDLTGNASLRNRK